MFSVLGQKCEAFKVSNVPVDILQAISYISFKFYSFSVLKQAAPQIINRNNNNKT